MIKVFSFISNTLRTIIVGIGIVLVLLGGLLSLTFIGAIFGIPLLIMGIIIIVIGSLLPAKKRKQASKVKKFSKEGAINVSAKRVK